MGELTTLHRRPNRMGRGHPSSHPSPSTPSRLDLGASVLLLVYHILIPSAAAVFISVQNLAIIGKGVLAWGWGTAGQISPFSIDHKLVWTSLKHSRYGIGPIL